MDPKLMKIVNKATDLHGHLGPFLVIGVRIGLIGIRELGLEKNEKLHVTVMLKNSVPFSCVIDGIQVTTKCTIGNKKIRLKRASGIAAKFEIPEGRQVTVEVSPTTFERLKNELLRESVSSDEVKRLAQTVASLPEEELFIIRRT